MTKDIIQKIRKHLEKPVDTECGVVYLLAQVRKVVEDEPKPRPFALWLHSNWALHVDLSRPNTTLDFLRRIDEFIVSRVAGFVGGKVDGGKEQMLTEDFLYLHGFRVDLRRFLMSHDLPTRLCDNDQEWYPFIAAYAGVIQDGALSAAKTDELKAVEKVTFTKGKALSDRHHVPFAIRWNIHLKDGRILRIEVKDVLEGTYSSRMRLNPENDL